MKFDPDIEWLEKEPFPEISFITWASGIPDPRIDRCKLYPLQEILLIALCTFLTMGESFYDMERFGKQRLDWLRRFLPYKNGVPSHDTFARVLSILHPNLFDSWFQHWVDQVRKHPELIAIDGKSLRGSRNNAKHMPPVHLLNVFASEARVLIAQRQVDRKTNESTQIPQLLKTLALKGSTVTIDAAGCYSEIVQEIRRQKGDYVLALKGNQGTLRDLVEDGFAQGEKEGFSSNLYNKHEEMDKGHGRVEKRVCVCTEKIGWLGKDILERWPGLRSVVMVDRTYWRREQEHRQRRFFISSLAGDARQHLHAVRSHWSVESMHWVLDMTFGEDRCTVRQRRAARNLSSIRKAGMNLVRERRDRHHAESLRGIKFAACSNDRLLEGILRGW